MFACFLAVLAGAAFACEEAPPAHVPEPTGPVCEAISECGFWLGCAYLVPIDPKVSPPRWRVASGEHKDRVFVRKHSCSPAVGAGETCLEYCSGGSSVVCADGLAPEATKCDETARPQRATFQCKLEAGNACVKVE